MGAIQPFYPKLCRRKQDAKTESFNFVTLFNNVQQISFGSQK